MDRNKILLPLILIVFLLKGIFLILLIPPWEAPDESAHVGYVWYLYTYKKFPSKFTPFISKSIEKSLKDRRGKKVPQAQNPELFDRNDRRLENVRVELGSHPPLYYLSLLPFYRLSLFMNSYATVFLLRFATLLLGFIGVILSYLIAKKVSNGISPLITAALVAFHPMYSFMSSAVNNDMMVVTFFLSFTFLSLELLGKFDRKIYLFLIGVSALAPLVKPQLLIVFPLLIILIFFLKKKYRLTYNLGFLTILPSVLWFGYQYFTYGSAILSYSVQNKAGQLISPLRYPVEFVLSKQPVGIFMSFWGIFGWLDVPMPKWIYGLIFAVILISITGWVRFFIIRRFVKWSNTMHLLVLSFFLYALSIFIFDLQVFMLSGKFVIHGRYLLPILPLFLIFLLNGFMYYRKKYRTFLYALILGTMILSQIVAIITIKSYYYG